MKNLIKRTRFAIYILLTFVFTSCYSYKKMLPMKNDPCRYMPCDKNTEIGNSPIFIDSIRIDSLNAR